MDRLIETMSELLVNQNRENQNHRKIHNFDECRNPFAGGNVDDDEYFNEYEDVPHRHHRQL